MLMLVFFLSFQKKDTLLKNTMSMYGFYSSTLGQSWCYSLKGEFGYLYLKCLCFH